MAKKYYWLRLQKDFFKRHDIRIIESMPNGKDYILFYLKLLVESVSHNGELRFSETIPYSEEMLATITDTNIDIIRTAMKVFTQLGMIEVLEDQTLFMTEVNKMIGSADTDEHTRESARLRKQRQREREKLEKCDSHVTCHGELEIELEKELEIELEKELEIELDTEGVTRTPYSEIVSLYNQYCPSYPKLKILSDARKKAIKARLNMYSIEDFETLFKKAEASDFLKGNNKNNWSATFDWLIKDTNMAKVLDGNYDNKGSQGSADQHEKTRADILAWAERYDC